MKIEIDARWCKGCGLCASECPCGALAMDGERSGRGYRMPAARAPENCTGCRRCQWICPDMCIRVDKD